MTDVVLSPTEILAPNQPEPISLDKLRRQYSDFITAKKNELDEADLASRYYHGAQWDAVEIKTLQERGQPVITYNRIQRKVDGVVGLIEKLRQDPKAYPRNPSAPEDKGSELATAVLRYVLDASDWRSLSPDTAHDGAVCGIGGLSIELTQGDHGDVDVALEYVDPENFFYDPRSVMPDFADARYMGVGKWVDLEAAVELAPPEMASQIRDACEGGGSFDQADEKWNRRELQWSNSREKRVRLIDHWYKQAGKWMYCRHIGQLKIEEGPSPFVDHRGESICKYIMYSNGIDHDGDRYGFVRNMKGPQDEINHRRSKGLHLFNSRRAIMEEGAVDDREATRKEIARADGLITVRPGLRFEFDDAERATSASGNLQLLTEAKAELENFGPNPALIGQGTGVAGSSGRAIALLQQSGIAELGPFILRYRGWKLRVYRAVWSAVQRHWQAERWIRVTDDEELAPFLQVNGFDVDKRTGQPVLVNALGNLDVDIILDEGPDQVNSMADAYDTLIALSQRGTPIPPEIILELSSLPDSVKKKLLQKIEQAQQPNPMAQQGAALELQSKAASVQATQAKTAKDEMDAILKSQEAHAQAQLMAKDPFRGMVALGAGEQAFMTQQDRPAPMPG